MTWFFRIGAWAWRRRLSIALAWAAAGLAVPASAQQWREVRPALSEAEAKALRPRVTSIINSGQAPAAADLALLDKYFKQYEFSAMTGASPASLAALADARRRLVSQYLGSNKLSAATREHLNALTVGTMQAIAQGNFHPAVRFNAALILGQLDREPSRGSESPPVPLPAGTDALLGLVEKQEFKGVAVAPAVQVAALIGLERHVRFGVEPKLGERVSTAALAVARRSESPEELSREANDWTRRLAVEVLCSLHKDAVPAPVVAELAKLLADDAIGVDERCRMAEALRPAMFPADKGIDAKALLVALGELARDALNAESKEARDYQKELLGDDSGGAMMMEGGGFGGRGGGGGYGGGYGGGREMGMGGYGGMMEEVTGPRYEKRRMLHRVSSVASAVNAVKGAATADELKARFGELGSALEGIIALATSKDAVDVDVTRSVIETAARVEQLVAGWTGQPAAPAEEEADADAAFGAL